jgi:hypothetical protein
MAANPV